MMKGDPRVIEKLNYLLEGELTAINQYMLHAEMCEDWGYEKLSHSFKDRAITEMHHAEHLMERILFLEGQPIVSNLSKMNIGKVAEDQINNDHDMELQTVKDYNEAIVLCAECLDYGTRNLLTDILKDEETHVDELEDQQDQIDQMGIQIFLSTQKPEAK